MDIQSLINRIANSIRRGIRLLKQGHFSVFWKELKKRLYSQSLSFGLRRDLDEVFIAPDARISLSIRGLKEGDIDLLMENGKLDRDNPRLAAYQRSMVRSEIPSCYVAVTDTDEPCYMQWLIGPRKNPELQDHFGNLFPPLDDDEALLEAAYMRRTFRGLDIMPAAMARIAEKGKELGVRWTLTFVGTDNIPALRGCRRAGFSPYILRKEWWLFFCQFISFEAIPEEMLDRYEQVAVNAQKNQNSTSGNGHDPQNEDPLKYTEKYKREEQTSYKS